MRTTVVAQLLAWAKSDSKELDLGKLPTLRDFDYVCYLWEYQRYREIDDAIGPIRSYYGAYSGVMVPENHTAFVAVRGDRAHVAHIAHLDNMPLPHLSIGRGGDKRCVTRQLARLVKDSIESSDHILARLKEPDRTEAR